MDRGINPTKSNGESKIHELREEALSLKLEGMNIISKAAYVQTQAARFQQQFGDEDKAKTLLKQAARLHEKADQPINAVLLYIELDDMGSVKRIAPEALQQLGVESGLGKTLDKLSKVKEGSKEEAEAIAELKDNASKFVESGKRFMQQILERKD